MNRRPKLEIVKPPAEPTPEEIADLQKSMVGIIDHGEGILRYAEKYGAGDLFTLLPASEKTRAVTLYDQLLLHQARSFDPSGKIIV
jgi:hypothetical protein